MIGVLISLPASHVAHEQLTTARAMPPTGLSKTHATVSAAVHREIRAQIEETSGRCGECGPVCISPEIRLHMSISP
jgi:hypothetical protein